MIIGKTRTNQPVESDAGFDAQVEEVATELIEDGEVDNAKPIYCHPVSFNLNTTDVKFRLQCLIFNNDSTPFTTVASFLSYINNIANTIHQSVRIMMSGGYYQQGTGISIVSWFFDNSEGNIGVSGINPSDGSMITIETIYETPESIFPEGTIISDPVNKIN